MSQRWQAGAADSVQFLHHSTESPITARPPKDQPGPRRSTAIASSVNLCSCPFYRVSKWQAGELTPLRRSTQFGTPFGETVWQQGTAKRLELESTLIPPGRPRQDSENP